MPSTVQGRSMQEILDQILVVVVVYGRDPTAVESVVSLAASVQELDGNVDLLLYDNSPKASHTLPSMAVFRVTYFHNPANPGVAAAYNEGARLARESGKQWLLLLDQDTVFPRQALQTYLEALQEYPHQQLFVPRLQSGGYFCSPCRYWHGFGAPFAEVSPGVMALQGRSVLNSGMLVKLTAFDEIGGFDAEIPLDFADHDFCRRFADRFGSAVVLDMTCQHGFSDTESSSPERALARFDFFCRGARQSARTALDRVMHRLVMAFRCAVLMARYRTVRFLPLLWRYLVP